MQSAYKAVCVLLDREVLATGAAHDLRSALTAARGGLELRDGDLVPDVEAAFSRMEDLARELGAVVLGHAPESVLDIALEALRAEERSRREEGGRRVEVLTGVFGAGIVRPWGFARAQAWVRAAGLARCENDDDAEALAGARVRVAARLVGATCAFAPDADGVRGTLTVRRATG